MSKCNICGGPIFSDEPVADQPCLDCIMEPDLIDKTIERADAMSEFTQYRRKHIAELRPYIPGEDIWHVSVSDEDVKAGSPKEGDMIARNPKNHDDQWLVAAQYFADNFEPSEG